MIEYKSGRDCRFKFDQNRLMHGNARFQINLKINKGENAERRSVSDALKMLSEDAHVFKKKLENSKCLPLFADA